MSKITIIGPLSKDRVIKMDKSYGSAGGAVYFQTGVMNSLNINTTALITLSKDDVELLAGFGQNIDVVPLFKGKTMEFENIYPTDNPDFRIQKASIPFNPIMIEDMENLNLGEQDIILLGPLSPYDIPLETIQFLSGYKIPLYLGAQGYLRKLKGDKIVLSPWKEYKQFLKCIKIVFMDENEAKIISDEDLSLEETARILASFGPEEVVITRGSNGALIYSRKLDKVYKIPAFKAKKVVDPTGMGDTFMAAYCAKKLEIDNPEKCGKFAAAASVIKIEKIGPFNKNKALIEKRMNV